MSLSLTSKRIIAFTAFTVPSYIMAIVFFFIPLSVWAWYADPATTGGGQNTGFFIVFLIVATPFLAVPGALIAGFVALPIVDHALKATIRSRSDYVAFLLATVVCGLIAIVITYGIAWVGALFLR